MAIKEITEDQFNSYPSRKNAMSTFVAKEKQWFADDENNLLGTILLDNFDKDWSYVIMAKESDGNYGFIDAKVSLETKEISSRELKNRMKNLAQQGKIEESLFEDKVSGNSEESKLIITDINLEVKRYFKKYPDKLYNIDPRKFEELIASILEDFGFDIELTKATRDGGRDIIANIKNEVSNYLTYVECKRYAPDNKIDVKIIRQVSGVHNFHRPSKSLIVTTSTFTPDAIKEASILKDQIDLKDYNHLKEWLSRY
ncbi:restriction endonuclease [uncultured Christiangramia sp.]|uniref:restriction endonuclease n=1 Tax=Christiangramia sp. 3-2217-3z TaxID=3417564 RepID=UPI00262F7E83|nr:restriction endonuclease [uncultured Christiangramia sp.]